MTRRTIMKLLLATCLVATGLLGAGGERLGTAASAGPNPVVDENQRAGSTGWKLQRPADDVGLQIKGFASSTSVNAGGSVSFHVSVSTPQSFTIEVYRMGWYGGQGGRLMTTLGPLPGTTKAAPSVDPVTGRVTTSWAPDATLRIPFGWTSGVYIGRLVRADGFDNYVVFVVRNDGRSADAVVQIPVLTYQAYNNFPNDGTTGKSLYDYNSFGSIPTGGVGTVRAVEVSFDRPYTGAGSGQFFEWDFPLVRWLEREGYDVSYITNVDLHARPGQLGGYRAFLSSGHDEYWSTTMYDAAEAARDRPFRPVDLAFFGANPTYWKVTLAPSSSNGAPNRVVRSRKLDATELWRLLGRPEQRLVGVQFSPPISDDFQPLIVTNANHGVWVGTGATEGTAVPGLVGYEVDIVDPSYPGPTSSNRTILASSPFFGITQSTSIYKAPSGAWVFGAGTMNWSWGLGDPNHPATESPIIQQATRNILNRMLDNDAVRTCAGRTVTVRLAWGETPTATSDVILGTDRDDVIDAGGGNDVVCGLGGNDVIRGGNGSDTLSGGPGDDLLDGGPGSDTCNGDVGTNTLISC